MIDLSDRLNEVFSFPLPARMVVVNLFLASVGAISAEHFVLEDVPLVTDHIDLLIAALLVISHHKRGSILLLFLDLLNLIV